MGNKQARDVADANERLRGRGRALTYAEKRKVMERILAAWSAMPHLRLSQFIVNATSRVYAGRPNPVDQDIFYVEDEILAEACEAYVKWSTDAPETQSSDR